MGKNNIRSFRYSDRVAMILEGFEGENMNSKFENLVLYCFDKVPELEEREKRLKAEISKLIANVSDVSVFKREVESFEREFIRVCQIAKDLSNKHCNTM